MRKQGNEVRLCFPLTAGSLTLDARQVSHGVLVYLTYLTLLYGPASPQLLLVEEPENGLHPSALSDVVRILREIVDERRQVVLTTHSPYLVDELEAREVRMVRAGESGGVEVIAMTELPGIESLQDIYRPGEIWTLFNEGGLPTPAAADA